MNQISLNELLEFYSDRTLHELQGKLNTFNPFEVLRIKDHEIRHTNTLAWLFDPYENHGFDDFLLKQFILRILSSRETEELEGLIAQTIRVNGLQARCYREYRTEKGRSIDLLIVIENLDLILLIENKIKAKEHGDQLASYLDSIQKKYSPNNTKKEYTIIPIFLTLDGDEPSHPSYSSVSYESIIELIKDSLTINSGILPEQKIFIDSYISILEGIVGQGNQELIKVAEEIYAVHRKAIEFIIQNTVQDTFTHAFSQFTEQGEKHTIKTSRSTYNAFTTAALERIENIQVDRWFVENKDKPICILFMRRNENRIGIVIEVGPVSDRDIRNELLNKLEDAGFRFSKNARNQKTRYTRIYSHYKDFKSLDSAEEICEAMNTLYAESLEKITKTEKLLTEFSNSI